MVSIALCMERRELRHDRHTVSLLTDHMVITPKYRGKILVGDVALVVEGIIRKTCKEMNIEIIDMAVNVDHVHLFIEYPPKYSVIEQDTDTTLPTSQGMVQGSSMGSRMLPWLGWSWMGGCGEIHRDARLCAKGRIAMHKPCT